MSLSSTPSTPTVSASPLSVSRTSRTFSGWFDSVRLTFGAAAITGSTIRAGERASSNPRRSANPTGSCCRSALGVCQRAKLIERASQEARDLHLRDAHARRDLRLRQVLDETHAQDLALALGNPPEHGADRRIELHQLVARVLLAHRVAVGRRFVRRARARGVERERLICLDRLQRVDNVILP